MQKRSRVIETAEGRGGKVVLFSRQTPAGARYEITIGGHFAMSAADEETERLIARLALRRLGRAEDLKVLVGGLGLGLTLKEVLDDGRVAEATVAEIEEAIVRWNRTWLRELNGGALLDRRTRVFRGDVLDLIETSKAAFDAVVMDVDNGPSFLIHERNACLYADRGIRNMRRCLAPGGVLAVWSGQPDPGFEQQLADHFAAVKVDLFPDPRNRKHVPPTAIYTALRP